MTYEYRETERGSVKRQTEKVRKTRETRRDMTEILRQTGTEKAKDTRKRQTKERDNLQVDLKSAKETD